MCRLSLVFAGLLFASLAYGQSLPSPNFAGVNIAAGGSYKINGTPVLVSALSSGAKCDGTTDDTSAIQAAVNAMQARGSGTITFPNGTCVVSGEITISSGTVHLVGASRGATTIRTTNGAANVFQFNGTTFDSSIRGMKITTSATSPTAGFAVVQSGGVGNIRLDDLRIEKVYNGVGMSNAGTTGVASLSHVDISAVVNDSVLIDGCSQFFMSDSTTFQSSGSGIGVHIVAAAGFYISNVTSGGAFAALRIDPPTGKQVFDGFLTNFEADLNSGAGMVFDSSGGGVIHSILMNNVRSGFNSGVGYYFDGVNTSRISLANSSATRNAHEGFKIVNLKDSTFIGNQLSGNAATSSDWGINVVAGDGLIITGNRVTYAYPGEANSGMTYGIVIQASFTGQALVTRNDARGAVTAGVSNGSSTATVADNLQ